MRMLLEVKYALVRSPGTDTLKQVNEPNFIRHEQDRHTSRPSCAFHGNFCSIPTLSNVRVSQRAGTKLVDIYYDVSDSDGGPLRVEVQDSSNAGR